MPHKFKIGQSVMPTVGRHEPPTVYTIMRLLPRLPNSELQYRIKSVTDGAERVVREIEIKRT